MGAFANVLPAPGHMCLSVLDLALACCLHACARQGRSGRAASARPSLSCWCCPSPSLPSPSPCPEPRTPAPLPCGRSCCVTSGVGFAASLPRSLGVRRMGVEDKSTAPAADAWPAAVPAAAAWPAAWLAAAAWLADVGPASCAPCCGSPRLAVPRSLASAGRSGACSLGSARTRCWWPPLMRSSRAEPSRRTSWPTWRLPSRRRCPWSRTDAPGSACEGCPTRAKPGHPRRPR